MRPKIVLFRQDLRLEDNPALYEAAKGGAPLIPVYIFDTKFPGKWQIGAAQKWWLHFSLKSLQDELSKQMISLILRKGDPLQILRNMAAETKASEIYWNRCYEPFALSRDQKLKAGLKALGADVKTFNGSLLLEPWEIKNKNGDFFKVFSPYWKTCLKELDPENPLPIPTINPYPKELSSDLLEHWDLLPRNPDWARGFGENWSPGSLAAKEILNKFVEQDLKEYKNLRDFPGADRTSRLSPHIHMGEVSVRQIWHIAKKRESEQPLKNGLESFLSEIGWREFSYYLLYHFPDLPHLPFNSKFSKFQWGDDARSLKLWQKGETGYPIVDAGMRQLWHMGWMHNRVRMIVGSFLIKDLLINWVEGEKWFWDTLVDADLANNAANWQWIAGCGVDPAPYFRIFNPSLQGEKFDPDGSYIRRWVPELKSMPNSYIHRPWDAPKTILENSCIRLGIHYPVPIVDHKVSRKESLRRFGLIK